MRVKKQSWKLYGAGAHGYLLSFSKPAKVTPLRLSVFVGIWQTGQRRHGGSDYGLDITKKLLIFEMFDQLERMNRLSDQFKLEALPMTVHQYVRNTSLAREQKDPRSREHLAD